MSHCKNAYEFVVTADLYAFIDQQNAQLLLRHTTLKEYALEGRKRVEERFDDLGQQLSWNGRKYLHVVPWHLRYCCTLQRLI